jgi:ankyrin repeat protein
MRKTIILSISMLSLAASFFVAPASCQHQAKPSVPQANSPRTKAQAQLDRALFLAVDKGQLQKAEALLKKGASPHTVQMSIPGVSNTLDHSHLQEQPNDVGDPTYLKIKMPVLIRAISNGEVEMTNLLIKYGADVNVRDTHPQKSDSALAWAVEGGKKKLIDLLLAHGARVDQGAFASASFHQDGSITQRLMEFQRKQDAQAKMDYDLFMAVEQGQIEQAKNLLKSGASVNTVQFTLVSPPKILDSAPNTEKQKRKDKPVTKRTPLPALFRAIEKSDLAMTKLLLDSGAIISDKEGFLNALPWAIYYGNSEIVDLLLERNAPVDAQALNAATRVKNEGLLKRLRQMIQQREEKK